MSKTKRLFLGGLLGIILTSIGAFTYFYTVITLAVRKIRKGFKNLEDLE